MTTKATAASESLTRLHKQIEESLRKRIRQQVRDAAGAFLLKACEGSTFFTYEPKERESYHQIDRGVSFPRDQSIDGWRVEPEGLVGYSLSTVMDTIVRTLTEVRVEREMPDAISAFVAKVEGILP